MVYDRATQLADRRPHPNLSSVKTGPQVQLCGLILNTKLFSNKISKIFQAFGAIAHSQHGLTAPLKGLTNNMISMKNRKKKFSSVEDLLFMPVLSTKFVSAI